MRVRYNVWRTMGLLSGHITWQIYWLSNGSMWNCYSLQPLGPWMGCPFTDLGAKECYLSINALFLSVDIVPWYPFNSKTALLEVTAPDQNRKRSYYPSQWVKSYKQLEISVIIFQLVTSYGHIDTPANIGSSNGSPPDGTKPLTETNLIIDDLRPSQWSNVYFSYLV